MARSGKLNKDIISLTVIEIKFTYQLVAEQAYLGPYVSLGSAFPP